MNAIPGPIFRRSRFDRPVKQLLESDKCCSKLFRKFLHDGASLGHFGNPLFRDHPAAQHKRFAEDEADLGIRLEGPMEVIALDPFVFWNVDAVVSHETRATCHSPRSGRRANQA